MIKSTLIDAMYEIWPTVVFLTVILTSLRITYFIYSREKFILYKELLNLIFLIYLLILFYIVTFQDNNYGFANFIPFKEMFRYEIGSRLFYKNIVGNILLFIPFGLFASFYVHKRKLLPILILSSISSLTIEIIQTTVGRVFDIDDIILNIVGGVVGYILYVFIESIKNRLPETFKKVWFINIVLILILLSILLYITNLREYIWGLI